MWPEDGPFRGVPGIVSGYLSLCRGSASHVGSSYPGTGLQDALAQRRALTSEINGQTCAHLLVLAQCIYLFSA